jgi:hypothetical protein
MTAHLFILVVKVADFVLMSHKHASGPWVAKLCAECAYEVSEIRGGRTYERYKSFPHKNIC